MIGGEMWPIYGSDEQSSGGACDNCLVFSGRCIRNGDNPLSTVKLLFFSHKFKKSHRSGLLSFGIICECVKSFLIWFEYPWAFAYAQSRCMRNNYVLTKMNDKQQFIGVEHDIYLYLMMV